jgi:hypothetical protein
LHDEQLGTIGPAPRDIFYSQGLWWIFTVSSPDQEIVYRTSSDGVTWGAPTVIGPWGDYFDVWVKGALVYYVEDNYTVTAPVAFYYRFGTLEKNGSILWAMPGTTTNFGGPTCPTFALTVDGQNDVWVAAGICGSNGSSIEVFRNSGNDTPWVRTADPPLQSTGEPNLMLLSLRSGVALLCGNYYDYYPVNLTVTSDDGATWTRPVSTSSDYSFLSSSALAINDTVYFAGPAAKTNTINGSTRLFVDFWSYTYGANSISPETRVAPGADASLSASGDRLVVVFPGPAPARTPIPDAAVMYEESSADLGKTWSCAESISSVTSDISWATSTVSGAFGAAWSWGAGWGEVTTYVGADMPLLCESGVSLGVPIEESNVAVVTAGVHDKVGDPLPDANLTLTVNSTVVEQAVSNESGFADFAVPLSSKYAYVLTASFSGSPQAYSSSNTTEFVYLTLSSPYGVTYGQGWYKIRSDMPNGYLVQSFQVFQGNGTERVFNTWLQNGKTPDRTIDKPITLVASWNTLYSFNWTSPTGIFLWEDYYIYIGPTGETSSCVQRCTIVEYYPKGSYANLTLLGTSEQSVLFTSEVFSGWKGDASGSSTTIHILMNGPKAVTATWTTSYTNLYIVTSLVAVCVLVAGLFLRRGMRNERAKPNSEPS